LGPIQTTHADADAATSDSTTYTSTNGLANTITNSMADHFATNRHRSTDKIPNISTNGSSNDNSNCYRNKSTDGKSNRS
jgi:hypothetical protein